MLTFDFQNGDASFTYGCLEPTMLTQMAKYLDTVYVSGWQSSSTASSTDEPSPDLADYPMVPHLSEVTILVVTNYK
jgi:isocitrate lyase